MKRPCGRKSTNVSTISWRLSYRPNPLVCCTGHQSSQTIQRKACKVHLSDINILASWGRKFYDIWHIFVVELAELFLWSRRIFIIFRWHSCTKWNYFDSQHHLFLRFLFVKQKSCSWLAMQIAVITVYMYVYSANYTIYYILHSLASFRRWGFVAEVERGVKSCISSEEK